MSTTTGRAVQRTPRKRTDWFRILADLQYAGLCNLDVSRELNVPVSTLRMWKQGAEPSHDRGDALLLLWTDKVGRPISARPMTFD